MANRYDNNLKNLEKSGLIKLPSKYSTNSKSMSTYQNYEIKVESSDELMRYLKSKKIGTIKQWGGFSIAHFKKLGYSIKIFQKQKNCLEDYCFCH